MTYKNIHGSTIHNRKNTENNPVFINWNMISVMRYMMYRVDYKCVVKCTTVSQNAWINLSVTVPCEKKLVAKDYIQHVPFL